MPETSAPEKKIEEVAFKDVLENTGVLDAEIKNNKLNDADIKYRNYLNKLYGKRNSARQTLLAMYQDISTLDIQKEIELVYELDNIDIQVKTVLDLYRKHFCMDLQLVSTDASAK